MAMQDRIWHGNTTTLQHVNNFNHLNMMGKSKDWCIQKNFSSNIYFITNQMLEKHFLLEMRWFNAHMYLQYWTPT